jgi:hypothetical protein
MITVDTSEVIAAVIDELEYRHDWPLVDAIADTAEVIGATKAEVVSAWLFADRYTGGFSL